MNWRPLRPPLAPFLAAWYLAMILLAEGGFDRARAPDITGTLIYATVTAFVAWMLALRVIGERSRATVLAVILVAWFGLFGTARLLMGPHLGAVGESPWLLLLLWTVPGVVAVLLLRHAPPLGTGFLRGFSAALGLLVLISTLPLWPLVRLGTRAERARSFVNTRTTARPDVYVVLLDMFSSPSNLKANYGLDLGWFVDSLRSLGFVVPTRARTNYIHTGLVLPTFLNSRLIGPELARSGSNPWPESARLIEGANLWTVLHAQGYRTAFFPTGYSGTLKNDKADLVFADPEAPFDRLGQTWIFNSPLDLGETHGCKGEMCPGGANFPIPVEGTRVLKWKLKTMAALPDSAGPIGAFVHFLGSHEPFVFNHNCSPRSPWWPRAENGPDSLEIRAAYAAQIDCVAHLTIDAVTQLIVKSTIPPVIILQSDHGNAGIRIGDMRARTVSFAEASATQRNERMEVFAAYRFPGAVRVVYDTITPVNVLPLVFNALFHAGLPTQPDRSFWSTWQDPLDLTEVHWVGDTVRPIHLP